jgi:hypothetical protein
MSGKNELEVLKKQLHAFRLTGLMQNPPEGLRNVVERTLQNYIETSLEASVAPRIIKEQLNELCKKHSLISSEMLSWALREHEKLVKKKSPTTIQGTEVAQVPQEVASAKETGAPLLSPSVLYHASLVCEAVNTCVNTKSVHEFLKKKGHELDEVSFSLPNDDIDQYLVAIAKREDSHSVIYVAFRSKPALKSWLSQHKSFEEGTILVICTHHAYMQKRYASSILSSCFENIVGLKDQTQKIPLRFFIEQLLKKNKIVFTGMVRVEKSYTVPRYIAGNFRGVQFSRMTSLQSFCGLIFADACDHAPYNHTYFAGLIFAIRENHENWTPRKIFRYTVYQIPITVGRVLIAKFSRARNQLIRRNKLTQF